jgi:LmbE family N-acetylglucosaminyl deacetylase
MSRKGKNRFLVILWALAILVGWAVSGMAWAAEPTNGSDAGNKKLRIVLFGAHCDDNELGAGGLMRMLADQGHEVISAYATAFRRGRMVLGQPEETVRRGESTDSCKILGATPYFFPFAHEDLEKPFAEKQTISAIIAWLDEVQPDIVLAHWPLDTHSNHQVVGMTTWMAYDHLGRVWGSDDATAKKDAQKKKSWTLYFYEVNTFTDSKDLETLAFKPNCYLDVSKVRDTKKQATDCLKSQDPKALWTVHDNMHVQRGKECGVPYAEAFFLVEQKPGCPLLPVPFVQQK